MVIVLPVLIKVENLTETIVVALGGNALIQAKQLGTYEEQLENVTETAIHIANMIDDGYRVILTHGNGPQVGTLLLQYDAGNKIHNRPIQPMDVAGSMTQGQIGYMFQRILGNILRQKKIDKQVATLVTQVLVSKDDQAFANPTKPVGPFYSKEDADKIKEEHPDWQIIEDAGRGYRRVVPSPDPIKIVEKDYVNTLISAGFIVITSGGGGIPVIQTEEGDLEGREAVIDKDLAAQRLALDTNAEIMLILTDTPNVSLNFNTPEQEDLTNVSLAEAKKYMAEGHFAPGSMGPKMKAAIRFLENGGKKVIITRPELSFVALKGDKGTTITTENNLN